MSSSGLIGIGQYQGRGTFIVSPVTVVPQIPPKLIGPEWFARPIWNPERSHFGVIQGPGSMLVIVPPSPPEVIAPERPRYPWSPERSSWLNVSGPASLLVVVPRSPVPPELPGRARFPWEPERSGAWLPPGTSKELVVVPASPVPPVTPEGYVRWNWSPERTATSFVFVPPPPPPLRGQMAILPDIYARKEWNPERTGIHIPLLPPTGVVTAIRGPVTVDINEPFDVHMDVTSLLPSGFELDIRNAITWSKPATGALSEIWYPANTKAGYAVMPTEGPVLVSFGKMITLTWQAVAFQSGLFLVYAAVVDVYGNYYEPAPLSVMVIGVK